MADEKVVSVLDFIREMQKLVNEHVRLSLTQYREMMGLYGVPSKVMKDTMGDFWPEGSEKVFEFFDRWFEEQMKLLERNIESSMGETVKRFAAEDMPMPTGRDMQKFMGEHADLWLRNYRKLKENREQMNGATLEFLKKVLPETMHPVLENANKWMNAQNEKLEAEMAKKLQAKSASVKLSGPAKKKKGKRK